ncbi:hypothetical protein F8388_018266 [Cannabis sativa]|uniref:Ycf2 N-terminal domain-containing protein n=1 Tax=Cannabis sativa TaxID=3483 RepID=A0A7J6EIZ1_CANSA|nr:hypothetical protein F8388_018266 [Cannabis sativa]
MQIFQQSLQELENPPESRETSTSEYEIQCSNIIPSQVESDPIENVNGITVQSGTQLESPHQDINDLIPSHEVRKSSLEECLWAISNEIVAGIEISFKEKDTKYLEFPFVYYMDDPIREDHDWELFYRLSPRKRRNIINLSST